MSGETRALAQSISLVEDSAVAAATFLRPLGAPMTLPRIVGVTGPPGAGKSTLTARLALSLLERGEKVALLLIDPSSPFSGGAILGDRIRMHDLAGRTEVFIRSLSSRGSLGGLSTAAIRVLRLLEYCDFSTIILETVGTGQAETDVVEAVDTVVVVAVPGLGDDIQAMKAGIMEIADIFVVNKADREGAERTARQIEAMLGLQEGKQRLPVPVVQTVATTGQGISELLQALDRHTAYLTTSMELKIRREKRWQKEFDAYVKSLLVDDFLVWARGSTEEVAPLVPRGASDIYSLAEQLVAKYYAERTRRDAEEN